MKRASSQVILEMFEASRNSRELIRTALVERFNSIMKFLRFKVQRSLNETVEIPLIQFGMKGEP